MLKNSLVLKKFYLKENNIEIFNNIALSLPIFSINFILNEPELTNTLFKCILNLKDSKARASLFNNPIDKSFEEIGYYNVDINIFKDVTVKDFFKMSNAYYKNDYSDELNHLIDLFEIDTKALISKLDKEHYELIKLIDTMYHNPSLVIMYEPFTNLSDTNVSKLTNAIINLKNNGTTFLIYTKTLKPLYDEANRYYFFYNSKLQTEKELKIKKYEIKYIGNITNLKLKLLKNETFEDYNVLTYVGNILLILKELILNDITILDIKVGDVL